MCMINNMNLMKIEPDTIYLEYPAISLIMLRLIGIGYRKKKSLFILLLLFTTFSTYAQIHKISQILDEIDSNNHLNGVVLVGKEGETILQKAYGMANYSSEIPNKMDHKFLIGSMSKQFTALLVMQSVEAGKLNLDAPITTYLPDFRKETGDKITIRHLLTHTHGILNADLKERNRPMPQEEFIEKYCETDLEFQPGSQFKYSDIVGYYLLGVILEKVTNKDFATLLEENILVPLDMKNTGYYTEGIIQEKFASGHIKKGNSFQKAQKWHMSQSFSAAAMYSTVEDLFKWDQALRGNKLLSKEGIQTTFTPYSNTIKYGFGWYLNDPVINGEKHIFAGHNGSANGYKSQIMRGLNDDLVIIYLSNTDNYVELRYPIIEAMMSAKK